MPTFISPTGNPEVWAEKPLGYFTPEEWAAAHRDEMAEADRLARIAEIDAELDQLDLRSIRPLRSILDETADPDDLTRLADLRRKAEALRQERRELLEAAHG
mgnify:CR=1 FL=1